MKLPHFKINKRKVQRQAITTAIVAGVTCAGVVTASLYFNTYKWSYQSPVILQSPVIIERRSAELVSPLVEVQAQTAPSATESAAVATPTPQPQSNMLEGEASYYSKAGCLGCSPTLTMANGQTLDDEAYTLALTPELYRKYKNQIVLIENTANGQKVAAQVTDSGGFAKYNRVADLSLATKQALQCGDLCQVKINLPEGK